MKNLLLADFTNFEIKNSIKIKGGEGIQKLAGAPGDDDDDDTEGV